MEIQKTMTMGSELLEHRALEQTETQTEQQNRVMIADESLQGQQEQNLQNPVEVQEVPAAQAIGGLRFASELKEEDQTETWRKDVKTALRGLSDYYRSFAGESKEFNKILETLNKYVGMDVNALSEEKEVKAEQDILLSLMEQMDSYLENGEKLRGRLPKEVEQRRLAVQDLKRYFFLENGGNLGEPPADAKQITATQKDFSQGFGQRNKDMSKIPLFSHEPSIGDIHQGNMGDCYFMAALASVVSKDPRAIKDCMRDNGDGTVTVRFFDNNSDPLYVTVDKVIPKKPIWQGGGDAGSKSCLWVQMMERAYAASRLKVKEAPDGAKVGDTCQEKYDAYMEEAEKLRDQIKAAADQKDSAEVKRHKDSLQQLKNKYVFLFDGSGSLTKQFHMDYRFISEGGDPAIALKHLLGGQYDENDKKREVATLETIARDFYKNNEADPVAMSKRAFYTKLRPGDPLLSTEEQTTDTKKKQLTAREDVFHNMGNVIWRRAVDNNAMYEVDLTAEGYEQKIRQIFEEARAGLFKDTGMMFLINRDALTGWDPRQLTNEQLVAEAMQENEQRKNLLDQISMEVMNCLVAEFMAQRQFDPRVRARTGKYSKEEDATFDRIETALKQGKYVVASTRHEEGEGTGLNGEVEDKEGIVFGHAYTVLGTEVRGDIRYVKMRNPWGSRIIKYHEEGEEEPLRAEKGENEQGGVFLIELSDLHRFYSRVQIVGARQQPVQGRTRREEDRVARQAQREQDILARQAQADQAALIDQARNKQAEERKAVIDKLAERSENPQIDQVAPATVQRDGRGQSKKERRQENKIKKAFEEAQKAENAVRNMDRSALARRREAASIIRNSEQAFRENYQQKFTKDEKKVLEKRLEAIRLQETARLVTAAELARREKLNGVVPPLDESYSQMVTSEDDMEIEAREARAGSEGYAEDISQRRELRIRMESLDKQIQALDEYAKLLPARSTERGRILARKEEMVVERGKLRQKRKVLGMKPGAERKREEDTIARHGRFDILMGLLRKDNPASHEGVQCLHPDTKHVLMNSGRATMGGTKPMYIFRDMNSDDEYLFKEAVNCVGLEKVQGALVTEAASKLQEIVCGAEASIPAFVLRNGDKVIGSMQKKINLYKGPEAEGQPEKIDLFKWQASREQAVKDGNNEKDTVLSDDVKNAVLREHVLDWVLCNFDTKGENFLQNEQGKLISFDKEASFSHIRDDGAQTMSYEYKPHSNDTIYNTIFRDFACNRIDLDLGSVLPYVEELQRMDDQEYLNIFDAMLTEKYGKEGSKREDVERRMLARKNDLKTEYERFFTQLMNERINAAVEAAKEKVLSEAGDAESAEVRQAAEMAGRRAEAETASMEGYDPETHTFSFSRLAQQPQQPQQQP